MFSIQHNDAITLEHAVRKLYKCERSGVSGLANADYFESHPMIAAIMVVSYIYAKEPQSSETQFADFLYRYDSIFTYPEENNAANEVKNYIKELEEIVNQYA